MAFTERLPLVHAIRVTPWPVTSPWRIALLAHRTTRLLAALTGQQRWVYSAAGLREGLRVDGRFIGEGYGRPSDSGRGAIRELGDFGATLDTTYSAKAAAGLLHLLSGLDGTTLFWATKSTAPLPKPDPAKLSLLRERPQRWLKLAHACVAEG